MTMTVIYFLADPITPRNPRYIGKTKTKLSKRLQAHIDESRRENTSYKNKWINSILKQNRKPIIVKMYECLQNQLPEVVEVRFIRKFLKKGIKLTNNITEVIYAGVKTVKILQYDLSGNYIRVFNSIEDACKILKYPRGRISSALQRNTSKGGNYLWKYFIVNFPLRISPYNFYKNTKISIIDCFENKEYVFNNIKEGLRFFNIKNGGHVNKSIIVKRKIYKRYLIKYIN